MNSENSLRSKSKSLRNPSLTTEALNNSLLPDKLNPHRISKRAYTNPIHSQKISTNVKRNSSNRRGKLQNSSHRQKGSIMPDTDMLNIPECTESLENLEQSNSYASMFCHEGKENLFFENSAVSQNYKETPSEQNHSKSTTYNSSQALSKEFNSSRKSQPESLKINRFSSFAESDTFSTDSRFMPSQEFIDCPNFSLEENSHSLRDLKASHPSSQRLMSQLTQDNNDYSDRETAEETVSCLSENNIGSVNTRLPKKLLKTESSMEKFVVDSKGPFIISQDVSCFTALDCEETLGFHSAVLANEKKEDSVIPYDLEFEQEFTLFSSTNTTPINKQIEDLTNNNSQISQSKLRPIEEELAAFDPESNPCAFDSDTISYLIKREGDYAPDPHFLEKRQSLMTWSMRAILLDWMMEVSTEFGLKRESFHYAVNYVDRYLTATSPVQKWELQLVGVTALYMAAKVEEIYPPRVSCFARSTDNAYTSQQILAMELNILKALKWLLTPPSLNTWANWFMNQWDLYVERSEYARSHPLIEPLAESEDIVQFKQSNQKSYARFREMMQIIDCALLDSQTLQYKPRALIASLMYILLGKYFGSFTTQQIFESFPYNSQYLLDTKNIFNDLFGDFLTYSFGFELIDLLPSIQYVSTYINLPVSLDLPKVVKMNKENVLEGHFEEFLAYQTHHSYNLQYIKKRPRNNI